MQGGLRRSNALAVDAPVVRRLLGAFPFEFGRLQLLPGGLDAAPARSHWSLRGQLAAKAVVLLIPSGRGEEKVRLGGFIASSAPVIAAVPPQGRATCWSQEKRVSGNFSKEVSVLTFRANLFGSLAELHD